MGVVYKAEDTKLKRTIALKFLPPDLTHIPDVKERFMREAQAAAALDHPNICTVYEFDEAEERTFISMAYVEGQSLKKKIESGPLELDEALKIATQVAEGLQEAHKKGVIHRDIKSGNIMVTEDGQAKIMDFGLARVTGGTLVTQEGMTMGTVTYMSPEQARGEKVDHRTDIWSLGVVMYEMLTGQLPFRGEHEQAIVYSILKEKPELITNINTDIPVSIEQVVSKALEKNPDKRYQKAEELLEDLKSISAGIVPEEIKARLRRAKLRKRKRAFLYGGSVGLVILAVLALIFFTGRAEAIDSIAVLPLENLTGNAEQDYFVDGMTDELIGQLAQISGLQRVISRTSVMRYKNTDKSLPEIAQELNVDALVEGTVYQIGENVSIKLQLFDALPEERSLWTQRYDRLVTEILVMYGEMARAIAQNIQVKLTSDEATRLAGARQVNPEAYEAYLKGQFYLAKFTPPDFETALHYYQMALDRDPDYALAYAGIALLWGARGQFGILPPNEAAQQARAAVARALELDSELAEVQYALAGIRAYYEWDWEGAEAAFKKAIELNRNFPDVRSLYSHFLCIMNRPDEALEQTERAMELDPFSDLIQGWHGWVLYMVRRYDDALALFQRMLRTSPNHVGALMGLWAVFDAMGMYDEALAAYESSYAVLGSDQAEEALALGYAKGGYREAMRRLGDTLATLRNVSYVLPTDIATSYIIAGENSRALDWLERGFEERDSNMLYLNAYPMYDRLRDDPRFQEILRKMNLPVDEKE